jgi:glutathione S-transferase
MSVELHFTLLFSSSQDAIKKEGTDQTARHVADLARQLGGKEYFATTFSFCDLTVYDWIDQVSGAFNAKGEVEKHDNLRAWHARVAANPRLQAYWNSKK